jgi:endonuclease/exonuclease/phosphatase (EEP) superfamily protein YafD
VLSINVSAHQVDIEALEQLIESELPDIVLFQEANWSNRDEMLSRLGAYYPTNVSDGGTCSTRVVSRFALLEQARNTDCTQAAARLAIPERMGGGEVLVASVHLPSPLHPDPPRSYVTDLQASMIDWANGSAIIGGDFNAASWSWRIRRFDSVDGFRRHTRAILTWPVPDRQRTSPHYPPLTLLSLDHIYATSDWRLVRIRRGPAVGSDHYPVMAEFARR